jgi:hypothetical protein
LQIYQIVESYYTNFEATIPITPGFQPSFASTNTLFSSGGKLFSTVHLLLSDDPEEAKELAEEIDELNKLRKDIVKQI